MVLPLAAALLLTLAQAPPAVDFPAAEYAARRTQLYERLGPALALVQGGPHVRGFDVFRQTNEFHYLCGIETPGTYLLLDARSRQATLYMPHRDEDRERGEGKVLSYEDAEQVMRLSGVERVRPVEQLAPDFKWILAREVPPLYVPHAPAEGARQSRDEAVAGNARLAQDAWDGRPSREGQLIALLRTRLPQFEIRDLTPHLDVLRTIKSPREVARLREAGRLTALGIIEAMRTTRPGITEYQLDAVARMVFRLQGARGVGYASIVGGGTNAWMGHWFRNSDPLHDGDLVLMDTAPDVAYYTSDIGRMWPVNGRFTQDQRDLLGFITAVQRALLAEIKPGISGTQVLENARPAMRAAFEAVAWSKPEYERAAAAAVEWNGHLSHPVGMTVHDVGNYRGRPLEPGMVFSVDPMLWVPEERLYVRVEDTVAVAADGVEVLTGLAPLDLDEIEALIAEPGLLEDRPDLLAAAPKTAPRAAPLWNQPRNTHTPRAYDVLHYGIELAIDDSRNAFSGQTSIQFRPLRGGLAELVLDAATFTVTGVRHADGRELAFAQADDRLTVQLPDGLPYGQPVVVRVAYRADGVAPDPVAYGLEAGYPLGLDFREATTDNPRLVATMSWPEGARHWFPCNDDPADKATADFAITARADWNVLANGRKLEIVDNPGAGTRTWHWRQEKPHTTYLAMVAAGPFTVIEDAFGKVPVSYWVYPQHAEAARTGLQRTPEILGWLQERYGFPYPWAKYAQVMVSEFGGGAESTSATILGDGSVRAIATRGPRSMDWLVAHEAAHQWWGDLITMREWGDAWLNESFATYSEYLWAAHDLSPEAAARNLEGKRQAYLREARERYRRPIVTDRWQRPDQVFDRHLYEKGALVLHLLRQEIGDEAFFSAMTEFLHRFAYRSATTADWIAVVEGTSGRDLGVFFDQWLFSPGHPVLRVSHAYDADAGVVRVTVEQTQDRSGGVPVYALNLPVVVETASGTQRHELEVARVVQEFALPTAAAPGRVRIDPDHQVLGEILGESAGTSGPQSGSK